MKNDASAFRGRWRHRILAIIAPLAIGMSLSASGEEAFEFVREPRDPARDRSIENGEYRESIARLEKSLGGARQPRSEKTPILIDLCIANTMLDQLDEASAWCDQAVATGWYRGIAYNARGVMHIASGDHAAAVRDFELAVDASGADGAARRNLQLVRNAQAVQDSAAYASNASAETPAE